MYNNILFYIKNTVNVHASNIYLYNLLNVHKAFKNVNKFIYTK